MSDGCRMFLDCIPSTTTHHHKRIVKRGKFASLADKPELVAAKATLDALLLPHQRPTITGPVVLSVVFTWPWLKGARKRDIAKGRIPHTSRPDCSNLVKTLEDRLVQLKFIEDDNAVVELHVAKWWGNGAGIEIEIRPKLESTSFSANGRYLHAGELFESEVAGPQSAHLDV